MLYYCFSYCSILSSKYSNCMPASLNIASDSAPAWYFFSQTTFLMPELMISMAQVLHGVILQYKVAPSTETPIFAAWQIAFCSACTVLTQWLVTLPSSWVVCLNWWPISSQCGNPGGEPTYHVQTICLFFAITHPLLPLSQVALLATVLATSIKYSSQVGRMYFSSFILRRVKGKIFFVLYFFVYNMSNGFLIGIYIVKSRKNDSMVSEIFIFIREIPYEIQ